MTPTSLFIGIDVSKFQLDVATRPELSHFSVTNDEAGVRDLTKRLNALRPDLIVLESTGGLETLAVSRFVTAGLPTVVVNPRQIRDFARATGQLAKTDTLDAEIIARFGESVRPAIRPLKDKALRELEALVLRRSQLTGMLTAERNRRAGASTAVRRSLDVPFLRSSAAFAMLITRWRRRSETCRRGGPRTSFCKALLGSVRYCR
jgi:transposase